MSDNSIRRFGQLHAAFPRSPIRFRRSSPRQARELQWSLRRVCTLAFVDPAMTKVQLRDQLQATLDGALVNSRIQRLS